MTNPSITKAQTRFLESLEHAHRDNTLQVYRKALEAFSNMLALQQIDASEVPVAELPEDSVSLFAEYMQNLSPATEALYLQVIKTFFEYLNANNLANLNPARVRMLIKQRTRRLSRESSKYPESDVQFLLDVIGNSHDLSPLTHDDKLGVLKLRLKRDRAIILVLADTGLRVEEVCQLHRGDIQWDTKRAVLKKQGSKQAIIRFSTRAINAVSDYLSAREPLDLATDRPLSSLPLFARHDKGAGREIKPVTPTTIRNIVAERVNEILGPEAVGSISPHTFLHYFVTTILRKTGNLKLAQVLARHTSIQTTQRYAHISDDELDRGYDAIFENKNQALHLE